MGPAAASSAGTTGDEDGEGAGHRDGAFDADEVTRAASAAFAPMHVRAKGPGRFPGSFRAVAAGDVVVTHITGPPCTVRRSAGLIGSGDRELVKVALHARGRAGVEQRGRQAVLGAGDLVHYTTDRPYELRFWEPFEAAVIGIPRALLGAHADALDRRTAVGVRTDQGVRRVVGTFFRTMADALDDDAFGGNAGRHLADALVSMVISELTEVPARQVEDDLAERVLAHCLGHLSDPALSPASVARAHGISVRHLHKLYESREQTLSSWIRSERLRRIRRDLADPALARRTVAAIAARWGVLDAAHLSRALKAEFGESAADIRRAATR